MWVMARKSELSLNFDQAHEAAYHSQPIVIRGVAGADHIKFYNLKRREPKAFQHDMCRIELEGKSILVRNQDILQAMSLM